MTPDCEFVKITRSEYDAIVARLSALERRCAAIEDWTGLAAWYVHRNNTEQLASHTHDITTGPALMAQAIHDAVMILEEDE